MDRGITSHEKHAAVKCFDPEGITELKDKNKELSKSYQDLQSQFGELYEACASLDSDD